MDLSMIVDFSGVPDTEATLLVTVFNSGQIDGGSGVIYAFPNKNDQYLTWNGSAWVLTNGAIAGFFAIAGGGGYGKYGVDAPGGGACWCPNPTIITWSTPFWATLCVRGYLTN
jgi:hypothetical protein